jgi:hypothetical protein
MLLSQMGHPEAAKDCFLNHLSMKEALSENQVSADTIKEARLLCDAGWRSYCEKNVFEAINCYEKAFYNVEHFVNSDTYLKFIIMLNIVYAC